ncbi:MAG: hypothetical protein LBN01_03880 [Endomicrobium sp.]|nr:hypothetical protein [Endomicrobium sp.]
MRVYNCFNNKVGGVDSGGSAQIFVYDETDNVWQMINWEVCPKILKRENEASDESPDIFGASFPQHDIFKRI